MMGLSDIPRRQQTSHSGPLAFLSRILFAHSRNEIYVCTSIRAARRFNIIATKLEFIIASQLFVRAVKHGRHYRRY